MRLASVLTATVAALASVAPAQSAAKSASTILTTNPTVSGVSVAVSRAVSGRFVSCPSKPKVSAQAVCLYSKQSAATARGAVKTSLGSQALGDWKVTGETGSLIVKDAAGKPGAFVLALPLSAQESLLLVDAVAPATKPRPAAPAGVVKGQPYVLGKDLIGLVNVKSLGSGKYSLALSGGKPLNVTVGQKAAQGADGKVELPLAPATDGQNLIFPLASLRALGCTFADAERGLTVTCGKSSLGVLPIVF